MPASKPPTWVFNTSKLDGLCPAFGNDQTIPPEAFVELGGKRKFVRIVRGTGNEANPHEDLDLTGATLTLAVGPRDNFPSTGSFLLTYGANTTANIAAGAVAATVETALNGLASIAAAGGVTVALKRSAYQVTFNVAGARTEIEIDVETLTPPARQNVQRIVTGDVDTAEVQLLSIKQDYWAATSDWDTEAAGAVSDAVLTPGTASVRKVEKIEITGDPTGGKFQVVSPQSAVHRINCVASTGGTKAVYRFLLTGNTIASGEYIDVTDGAGPVRIWFNIAAAGPAPAAPAGGRLLEIVSPDNTLANLGPNFWAAFLADSGLENAGTTYGYSYIDIRNKTAGEVTEPTPPGSFDFTFFQGSFGAIANTYFSIYDSVGEVGIWFNVGGSGTMPSALLSMSRTIEVTGLTASSNAAAVATALAAALDADSEFAAVAASAVVTVTDDKGGARSVATTRTFPGGVSQIKAGYLISAVLPHTATAAAMRTALRNLYDVTRTDKPGLIQFVLVASQAGELADIVASNISLVFPAIYSGTLSFNTATCLSAFSDAGDEVEELEATLEGQYQFPGEDPVKFYQETVLVRRALIDTTALSPINIIGSNYVDSSMAIPNGANYVDVVFPGGTTFPTSGFDVVSRSVENTVDTPPPDNLLLGIISNKTTTGFRQYFSGPTSNGNSVYKYVAAH